MSMQPRTPNEPPLTRAEKLKAVAALLAVIGMLCLMIFGLYGLNVEFAAWWRS